MPSSMRSPSFCFWCQPSADGPLALRPPSPRPSEARSQRRPETPDLPKKSPPERGIHPNCDLRTVRALRRRSPANHVGEVDQVRAKASSEVNWPEQPAHAPSLPLTLIRRAPSTVDSISPADSESEWFMEAPDADLPPQVAAIVGDNEVLLSQGWAHWQRSTAARTTASVLVQLLIALFDVFHNRSKMNRLQGSSAASGIPLERNMAIALTDQRLLLWKATPRPRRIGAFLGAVPRGRLASVHLPFTPSGPWRTLEIRTTDDIRFRLKVSAAAAEAIVDEVSNRA